MNLMKKVSSSKLTSSSIASKLLINIYSFDNCTFFSNMDLFWSKYQETIGYFLRNNY